MTEKANNVLHKLKQREALKRWRLLNNPDRRAGILEEFNRSTLEEAEPIGGDKGMKVLSEMNSLVDDHDEFVKSLGPRVDVL